MKHLTLETILRVVFGARGDDEAARLRDAVHGTLDTVRSMPRMLAMALVQRDLGPRSPWGRFRLAVERFDALLLDISRAGARGRRRLRARLLLEQRDEDGNPPTTAISATSSWRCSWPGTTPRRHRWRGRSSGWPATPRSRRACARATRDYLEAVVKEALRARPALTIAPRRLPEPVTIAGRDAARRRARRRLPVAGHAPRGPVAAGRGLPPRALARGAPPPNPLSWIPFGGGVRRCAGAPFAEMEMREVLRAAAAQLTLRPVRPEGEHARRSALVVTPDRGGEVLVER